VPSHRGKLIAATNDAEGDKLAEIKGRAEAMASEGTAVERRRARAMEPNLHCTAALLSPSTGIIDNHFAAGCRRRGRARRRGLPQP
jgi:L-2-hydroxyglutarate oxidase LhgO